MKMVEFAAIFLKGFEEKNVEPIISVIGVLFPIGDKFKNICSGNICSTLCKNFYEKGGYQGIRSYWNRIVKSKTNETILFNTLYLSLKPFKTV
jgi:hypothetical protein